MGSVIRLIDAISSIEEIDPGSTVYAKVPWNSESEAIVDFEPESGGIPESVANRSFEYFLEVFVILEVLQDSFEVPEEVDENIRCDRVIEYALNDA